MYQIILLTPGEIYLKGISANSLDMLKLIHLCRSVNITCKQIKPWNNKQGEAVKYTKFNPEKILGKLADNTPSNDTKNSIIAWTNIK